MEFNNEESEVYSEPMTIFFHDVKAPHKANVAFDLAARIFNLKVEKHQSEEYCINYFKLIDPQTQQYQKDTLFANGINLVRRLINYKRSELSEPDECKKVNLIELRKVLSKISSI